MLRDKLASGKEHKVFPRESSQLELQQRKQKRKKIIIHETVRRAYFLITELKRQWKKKANLLEKQENWPYMTNGWHVSVVKTDVQKYSDPQDHKNCTT